MKKLFDIDKGNVVMNPAVLWIPEFKKLWTRDKSKGKGMAHLEVSYVVFKNGFNSPYQAYSEKDREGKILNDYFSHLPDWEPDKVVKAAEKKYNELQDSVALRMLRTSKKALEKIEQFFDEAEPEDVDKIVKNAEKLGNLITSLNKLEEVVKKEQHDKAARGGEEIGLFEMT